MCVPAGGHCSCYVFFTVINEKNRWRVDTYVLGCQLENPSRWFNRIDFETQNRRRKKIGQKRQIDCSQTPNEPGRYWKEYPTDVLR